MQGTIQQLGVQKQELEQKLQVSAEKLSRKTSEFHYLEELCAREKATNERLAHQLEEAKLSPALQPDGRPSLGDGKVAQALRKENEDLLKQLNELQKTHLFKTKQLQDRIDELKVVETEYGKLKDEMATMRWGLLIFKLGELHIYCGALLFQTQLQLPGEGNGDRRADAEDLPLRAGVRGDQHQASIAAAPERRAACPAPEPGDGDGRPAAYRGQGPEVASPEHARRSAGCALQHAGQRHDDGSEL